jgi:hypothetical protein
MKRQGKDTPDSGSSDRGALKEPLRGVDAPGYQPNAGPKKERSGKSNSHDSFVLLRMWHPSYSLTKAVAELTGRDSTLHFITPPREP